MNRFEFDDTEEDEPSGTKQKDLVGFTSGPASSNPGQWLTEAYENCLDGGTGSEEYESVIAIIESYRPGIRTRVIRRPVFEEDHDPNDKRPAVEFETEKESIETRSICYSSGEGRANEFSMLGITGMVFETGVPSWPNDRNAESNECRRLNDANAVPPQVIPATRVVSQTSLDAQYAAWIAEPSIECSDTLKSDLHAFISRKAKLEGRSYKLRAQELAEDAVNDFLISLFSTLQKKLAEGKLIEKFSHYVSSAWKKRAISALQRLEKQNNLFPSITQGGCDEDDGSDNVIASLRDTGDFRQNFANIRSLKDRRLSDEARNMARQAKLPYLSEELRDYVELKLTMPLDKDIAKALNLSRYAVGRRKFKAKRKLQELEDAA